MTNQRWNEREDWRDRDSRREARQFEEGHNPAGAAQNYHGPEDRSWNARSGGDRFYGDYGARNYGDGGPTGYPREDYLGSSRRFEGGQRYGREGRGGQDYGYDRGAGGYGVEWSDRDSYDARRADSGGRGRYGREDYRADDRGDFRRGGYGQYDSDRGYQAYGRSGRDTGRDGGFGDPNPYVQAATDGETQGAHRGRGPSDYKRSDDRIREDVNDRLTDDAHIDASGIQVAVKDGEVTLSGTVDSRFAKRHAEDLADRISGAKHVQNNLRVSDATNRTRETTSTATTRGTSSFS